MIEWSVITHSIHRKRCKNVLLFLFPLTNFLTEKLTPLKDSRAYTCQRSTTLVMCFILMLVFATQMYTFLVSIMSARWLIIIPEYFLSGNIIEDWYTTYQDMSQTKSFFFNCLLLLFVIPNFCDFETLQLTGQVMKCWKFTNISNIDVFNLLSFTCCELCFVSTLFAFYHNLFRRVLVQFYGWYNNGVRCPVKDIWCCDWLCVTVQRKWQADWLWA